MRGRKIQILCNFEIVNREFQRLKMQWFKSDDEIYSKKEAEEKLQMAGSEQSKQDLGDGMKEGNTDQSLHDLSESSSIKA